MKKMHKLYKEACNLFGRYSAAKAAAAIAKALTNPQLPSSSMQSSQSDSIGQASCPNTSQDTKLPVDNLANSSISPCHSQNPQSSSPPLSVDSTSAPQSLPVSLQSPISLDPPSLSTLPSSLTSLSSNPHENHTPIASQADSHVYSEGVLHPFGSKDPSNLTSISEVIISDHDNHQCTVAELVSSLSSPLPPPPSPPLPHSRSPPPLPVQLTEISTSASLFERNQQAGKLLDSARRQ
ncbi:unnamed protein product [Protopolystoma xenopodis]|uniref:Uncharacterized protein n=1 Tax=Protopolystoma xenopodis TaxID=117903 RepID=A0A448WQD6_9PLAT|nr:unnamed protein product [Protopolystoma xenopodis]